MTAAPIQHGDHSRRLSKDDVEQLVNERLDILIKRGTWTKAQAEKLLGAAETVPDFMDRQALHQACIDLAVMNEQLSRHTLAACVAVAKAAKRCEAAEAEALAAQKSLFESHASISAAHQDLAAAVVERDQLKAELESTKQKLHAAEGNLDATTQQLTSYVVENDKLDRELKDANAKIRKLKSDVLGAEKERDEALMDRALRAKQRFDRGELQFLPISVQPFQTSATSERAPFPVNFPNGVYDVTDVGIYGPFFTAAHEIAKQLFPDYVMPRCGRYAVHGGVGTRVS